MVKLIPQAIFLSVLLVTSSCTTSPRTIGQATKQIKFRKCQDLEANRLGWNKQPEGVVQIEYSVDPKGNLMSSRILKNTTGNKNLEDCILGLIRSTDFPAEGGTENIVSQYTFETLIRK